MQFGNEIEFFHFSKKNKTHIEDGHSFVVATNLIHYW